MAPFIHDIYHHILLISDPVSMKELVLSTQTDMFFIASTCIGSVLDFPSIFDVCYMIDKKSMFVSSRVPVCIDHGTHVARINIRNSAS